MMAWLNKNILVNSRQSLQVTEVNNVTGILDLHIKILSKQDFLGDFTFLGQGGIEGLSQWGWGLGCPTSQKAKVEHLKKNRKHFCVCVWGGGGEEE